MRAAALRKWFGHIRRWPFHPQWLLVTSGEKDDLDRMLRELTGAVLDIGCAGRQLAARVPASCTYTGLDYPDTAVAMYRTRPDVFGDARALPFADESFDAIILKDVLEHIPDPFATLSEIARTLKDGGKFVLWIPFMYPVHDAPYDFQRFTEHGLARALEENGFATAELKPALAPIETAALMISLALADAAEQIITRRRAWLPIVPVIAVLVLISNLAGKALCWLPATRFMPAGYRIMAQRRSRAHDAGATTR